MYGSPDIAFFYCTIPTEIEMCSMVEFGSRWWAVVGYGIEGGTIKQESFADVTRIAESAPSRPTGDF